MYIPNEVKQQQVNAREGISTDNSLPSLPGPQAQDFQALYMGRGSFASSIQLLCCVIAETASEIAIVAESNIREKIN